MAEGASSESSRKEATKDVWAFRLFQNPEMATSLCCTQCGHPPKKCFVNNANLLLCEPHAEELIEKGNKINAQPFADGLISNSTIICPNILFDPRVNDDDEKKEEPKQCEHKCLIKNWCEHNTTTCAYTIVDCATCHSDFNASRCLQDEHNKTCGHVIIECEQKCPHKILRKDLESHKANDCPETILNCTNQTCSQKIARKLFTQHVNTCDKRIVECEYKKYGCTQENVKFEDMEQHMKLFETKHLQFHMNALFALVTQQQQCLQNDSEPSGMIRMFGGIDIPNGYVLCDGQNGTPDLRKKFELRGNEHGNVNDGFDVDQISECEIDDDDNNDVVPSYSMVYIMKS